MSLERKRKLYAEKSEAYAAWKHILDTASNDKRLLTAEEQAAVDQAETVIDRCNSDLQKIDEETRQRDKLAVIADELAEARKVPSGQLQQDGEMQKPDNRSLVEKLRDYSEAGLSRTEALAKLAVERTERSMAQAKALKQYLMHGSIDANLRSRVGLQMDSDTGGGFLVAPEQFIARLIQDIDRMVWFRNFATVIPLSGAESIGVPTLDTDIADTIWTTELSVGTEDTSLAFGKRRLTPHPVAKYIKVSKDLLASAALSVEAIVRERMAYKFGTVQETAFMTGSGALSPLGIFTASDNGITTSQDVSTSNTATAITVDGLINAKYGLESQWLGSPNLRWVFHRDAVKMIRKLKDGDGQYIWNPGLATDRPDTILNVPVLISEYAPNTFTASQYVGIIGDLSYYWIAETMSVEIQRLVELGALTNQDYFIGRAKLDGLPVLEKAFIRVKLAAS